MRSPIRYLPIIAVLALVTPALAGCIEHTTPASLDAGAAPEAGDVIAFEGLHTPDEIETIVDGYGALPGVDVATIGESVDGRNLQRVVLGDGPFTLWAMGRIHGNEPTGAEAILQIIPALADPDARLPADAPPILHALREHREEILERVTFVFVPVGNPDGAARFERHNTNDQDLNRDFYAFTQPESQAIRDAFWEHWPDACLDLHNKGWSDAYDYDAYAPVHLPESEIVADVMRASWRAVHEVDAAGGFGGGPNENYRLGGDGVARQVVNPTAVHPGPHDMFCSLRGAPGWTPEGALEWASGEPQENQRPYAWGTRSHAITIAAAALEAAGYYDGFPAPIVEKTEGTLGELGAEHIVDAPESGEITIRVVWREDAPKDKNPLPVAVDVEDPAGRTHTARLPHPDAFTATARFPDGEAGPYQVRIRGPAGVPYEVRTYVEPDAPAPLDVQATDDGLRVANPNPWSVTVTLSDVMDVLPADAVFEPAPDAVHDWNGTILPRTGVTWTLDLDAGASVGIAYPEDVEHRGPYRFVVTAEDGRVATGVEGVRATDRYG